MKLSLIPATLLTGALILAITADTTFAQNRGGGGGNRGSSGGNRGSSGGNRGSSGGQSFAGPTARTTMTPATA